MAELKSRNLNQAQLKGLSQFLNTVGAAWFTAGVVAPFFTNQESLIKVLILAFAAIMISAVFLVCSLLVLSRVKS